MPKVSVIIPVYGVEKYIERCARSLFEQTLDDIEYLFIDDCTPDRSIEILKQVLEEYPQRKPQVIIHRMGKNSGQAAVRKWGMMNATGEYVIHCDSDDWVDTDMYRSMYEKAKEDDADVVICGFVRSDGQRVLSKQDDAFIECKGNKKKLIQSLLVGRDLSSLCNKLVKTTLLHKDDFLYATNNMWEDFVYSFQFFLYAERICSVDKYFYHYYQNEDSICGQQDPDKILKRFYQIEENVKEIEQICINLCINKEFASQLVALKYKAKSELLPLVGSFKYWRIWLKSFSEINYRVLFVDTISWRGKVKFVVTLFGLYPMIFR